MPAPPAAEEIDGGAVTLAQAVVRRAAQDRFRDRGDQAETLIEAREELGTCDDGAIWGHRR